jgi:hypothetical protein
LALDRYRFVVYKPLGALKIDERLLIFGIFVVNTDCFLHVDHLLLFSSILASIIQLWKGHLTSKEDTGNLALA